MCVVALAWNAHPRWRLVLAGNRDEFHARPSAPLARWEAAEHVIGGRDLQAGGTWLGVSDRSRLAVVTNVRNPNPPDPNKASRGALVAEFLSGANSLDLLPVADLGRYNPFNLLAIDRDKAWLLTNRPGPAHNPLEPGIHSLSNGELGQAWRRQEQLHHAFSNWLNGPTDDPLNLLDILSVEHVELPPQETDEGGHHPLFLSDPVFGTRCSTIIAVAEDGHGFALERRFGPNGSPEGDSSVEFFWPA